MWIEERPDGRFRACAYYKDELTGKRKRCFVYMEKNNSKSRRAAMIELDKKVQKLSVSIDPDLITIEQLCELYMDDQKMTNKPSTVTRNQLFCNKFQKLLGADTLVERLTAGYVRKVLLNSGMEPISVNEFLIRFKSVIHWAYDNDYVTSAEWLDKLKPMKENRPEEDIKSKFLEQKELQELIEGMKVDKYRDLSIFLALSGLRIGEALALTIKDIDLKQRLIRVNKTWDHNNKILNDTTKTAAGRRDVYIQDELLPLCRILKQVARCEKMTYGLDLIFQDEGKRIQYPSYCKYIRTNSEKILKKRITPHVLRHTHVSLMAAAGLSFEEISRRVGHEDSRITKKIYFHVTENIKERDNQHVKSIALL